MQIARPFLVLLCAFALLGAAPVSLPAAEPERLSPAFDVRLGPGPLVEVMFTLALSEVSNYPVTITAISEGVEEQLWNGSLPEGVYRFQAPLTKIKSGPLKLVLRATVTDRREGDNHTFLSYQTWEGTIR